jgi:hypothetical protein
MTKPIRYAMIFETTEVNQPRDLVILENHQFEKGKNKVVFEARLQTINEVNSNKRYYPKSIGDTILEQMGPKAKNRSLLMEVDHPLIVSTDPELAKKRASIVEVKNTGAVLRDIGYKNNDIVGIVETLSGFKGPDLANLVIKDKVPIGFSLRAFGGLEERDGVLYVTQPFRAITYDIVSNPSHTNAKILDFLSESKDIVNEVNYLFEGGSDSILELDRIRLYKERPICEYLDEIITENFGNIVGRKIIFRI